MTTTTPPLDLDTITLGKGVHSKGSTEPCLLELSAWLAGEPWTDRPACVSPVLGAFGRSFNDALPTDRRQRLRPYAPRLLNTAGDAQADERRSYLALDWLVRTYLPTWLRLVPALTTQADLLSAAHEVTDLDSAAAIGDLVREAASQSSAAGDAARAAAGAAAGAAARAAARAAAWAAAGAAAGDAAGDAAWAAAWAAAGDAARAAAWAAAGDAARAAAWAAAGDAARAAAWAAAGDAARAALAPTVDALQDSAFDLLDRMLSVSA